MTATAEFWAVFVGAAASAILLIAAPLRRGRFGVIGVSQRDFPQIAVAGQKLRDPSLAAAMRRAFGGWRVSWTVMVFGLLAATVQAGLAAALPGPLRVDSPWIVGVRMSVGVSISFWVMSRLIVASIHRHMTDVNTGSSVAA